MIQPILYGPGFFRNGACRRLTETIRYRVVMNFYREGDFSIIGDGFPALFYLGTPSAQEHEYEEEEEDENEEDEEKKETEDDEEEDEDLIQALKGCEASCRMSWPS